MSAEPASEVERQQVEVGHLRAEIDMLRADLRDLGQAWEDVMRCRPPTAVARPTSVAPIGGWSSLDLVRADGDACFGIPGASLPGKVSNPTGPCVDPSTTAATTKPLAETVPQTLAFLRPTWQANKRNAKSINKPSPTCKAIAAWLAKTGASTVTAASAHAGIKARSNSVERVGTHLHGMVDWDLLTPHADEDDPTVFAVNRDALDDYLTFVATDNGPRDASWRRPDDWRERARKIRLSA